MTKKGKKAGQGSQIGEGRPWGAKDTTQNVVKGGENEDKGGEKRRIGGKEMGGRKKVNTKVVEKGYLRETKKPKWRSEQQGGKKEERGKWFWSIRETHVWVEGGKGSRREDAKRTRLYAEE